MRSGDLSTLIELLKAWEIWSAELLESPAGEAIRAQSPFGRVATPDEVALAIMSLAGSQAEWASGSIVDFNGASYLH